MVGRDCRERERAASAASEKRRSIGWRARRERRGGERAREHRDFLGAFRCSSRQHPAGGRDRTIKGGRAVEQRVGRGGPCLFPSRFLSFYLSLPLPPLVLRPAPIRK